MKYRFSSKALACLLAVAMAVGCQDPAYDLDNVDRNAKFGGDIDLPLGSTEKITLGGLIDDLAGDQFDDMIVKNADGTYSIVYGSDPCDLSFAFPPDIDRSLGLSQYKGKTLSLDYSLFSKPSSVQFDENGVADLSKRISATRNAPTMAYRLPFTIKNMPKQLNGLRSVLLSDDSQVIVSFSVANCLLTEGTIIPDLNFDLHELFGIKGVSSGIVNFSDVVLNKSNGFKNSKTLKLTKIIVDPDKFDPVARTLDLNAKISLGGTLRINNPKTTREQYQKAPNANTLVVTLKLVNVMCQGIEAKFVYEVDSVRSRLKLTKVARKFGGDDTPILFTEPELMLSYIGDFSVPAGVTATFVAQKDSVTINQVKNVRFNLPVASGSNKASRKFRFCVSGQGLDGAVGVKADIPKLFKPIPDVIYVYMDIATNKNQFGTLDLDKQYALQLDLSISSPLGYGPGLKLDTEQEVSLPPTIGKFLKNNSLKLVGDLTNTSPLQLELDFVLADEAGNAICPAATQTIAAGGTTAIELAFAPVKDAERIAKALLKLKAAPAQTGMPINANDYVQANLHFQIPGGFHFSF